MSRRAALALVVAGMALFAGAAATYAFGSGSNSVGDLAAVEQSLTSPLLPESVVEDELPEPVRSEPAVAAGPQEARSPVVKDPDEDVAEVFDQPTGLRIDRLGVAAPVDAYGVDGSQMAVPDNVSDVAWYRFGPSPGEPGSAVLAAHVDLAGQGPGVFFDLDDLEPGDSVWVDYRDGASRRFVVVARTTYEKDELPVDAIFARDGAPILTLITCGGDFNRRVARYDSNVVVYAAPAGTPDEDIS